MRHTLTGDLHLAPHRLRHCDKRAPPRPADEKIVPNKPKRQINCQLSCESQRFCSSSVVDVDGGASVRAVHAALIVLPAAQCEVELQACCLLPWQRAAAGPGACYRGGA